MTDKPEVKPYSGPAGGWGSLKSVGSILLQEDVAIIGSEMLMKQNKPDGFMCVSCAWAKPAEPHAVRVLRERRQGDRLGDHRQDDDAGVLRRAYGQRAADLVDHELEEHGRLTQPMRYDAASDRYVPVLWEEAFAEIGAELQGRSIPSRSCFYTSGRASLETCYMYQLFARMYGTNNLPDSSNMCHEIDLGRRCRSRSACRSARCCSRISTLADCIFFFGQNVGTNARGCCTRCRRPRKRGVPIITFNPLRERGLERFTNPQSPIEMLTRRATRISDAVSPGQGRRRHRRDHRASARR